MRSICFPLVSVLVILLYVFVTNTHDTNVRQSVENCLVAPQFGTRHCAHILSKTIYSSNIYTNAAKVFVIVMVVALFVFGAHSIGQLYDSSVDIEQCAINAAKRAIQEDADTPTRRPRLSI
jgi:hypothetical protein